MRSDLTSLALAALLGAAPLPALAQQGDVRPFAGYSPARCAVAARVIDELVRRPHADTGVYTPGSDTLFAASKDTIRACQAAFGGTSDAADERLDVARVERYTHQDSAALRTARRHMGTMTSRAPAERAWELYLIATDNLAGRSARLEPAAAAIRELDRLGTAASSVRVLAHYAMAGAAFARYDDETVLRETAASIAAFGELDPETKLWRATTVAAAYLTRAQLAALTRGADAARAVIDTARGVIPPAAAQARAMIEGAGRMYRIMEKPAAQLEAAFWYNAGADGTARPVRGKVSLLLPAYRPCTSSCPPMLRAAKRLATRFGARGLQLTFHTQTYGFYVDTAPTSAYDEARYDSTYFVGQLAIPGALAVAETQFSWKPDGRRVNSPTTNQQNYPAGIVFIDKRGIIRYVASGWQQSLEERYTRLIERLLAEDTSASPPPPNAAAQVRPSAKPPR